MNRPQLIKNIDDLITATDAAARLRLEIIHLLQHKIEKDTAVYEAIVAADKTFMKKLRTFPGDLTHVRLNKILTIIKDHNVEGE